MKPALVIGGGALALLLVVLLRPRPESINQVPQPVPVGTPSSSPARTAEPSVPTAPTDTPGAGARMETLGVSFVLPEGYRVASALNASDAQSGATGRFTITRASADRESEYLRLIGDLRARQAATEAPSFAPGQTITLETVTNPGAAEGDAALARERVAVTLASGLTGTRYRRVEGLQTFDVTYLQLPSGVTIALHMTYSTEEPQFDETAYTAVLESLTAGEGR